MGRRGISPLVYAFDEIAREAEIFPGRSDAAAEVRRLIARYAPRSKPVLVTGDTGVGKEIVAEALHAASPRRERPFVARNCAQLRGPLAESDLYGHDRGAFTGAVDRHIGAFEEADGGTVFLDEIGELDLVSQASLLRVLQKREYRRVGGRETLKCTAGVVAATNRDLALMVHDGLFREDLYYRIAVLEIRVPSLRTRLVDLPDLCRRLAPAICARLSTGAFAELAAHDWPGNVRELDNVLERLDAHCDAKSIGRDDVVAAIRRHVLCPPPVDTARFLRHLGRHPREERRHGLLRGLG